jgi:FixJ family two-component response regulator
MDIPRGIIAHEKSRILLVEDDPGVRRSLQLLLQANGFDVRAYASGAILLADETSLDAACLVADYRMSDCDGVETLQRLRARGWAGPAILITAFSSADLTVSAKQAGFYTVLEKPLRKHRLLAVVEQLVRQGSGG